MIILGYCVFNLVLLVYGQYARSPCPDVFEYKSDAASVYGLITLNPFGSVTSINLKINFTVATQLTSKYLGRIEPLGSEIKLLRDFNQGTAIRYRIHFPVSSPLPQITWISANDNVLCSFTPGQSNGYETSVKLEHTLYLKSGPTSSISYNPQQQNVVPTQVRPIIRPRPQTDITYDGFIRDFVRPSDPVYTYNPVNTHIIFNSTRPVYVPETRPEPRPDLRPEQRPVPQPSRPDPDQSRPESDDRFSNDNELVPECGVVAGGNERQALIYNGQSYERGDWPWLVAIYKRKDGSLSFNCAGTLVSQRHVITAAHCMQRKTSITSVQDFVIKVGVYNLEDWGDDYTITRTVSSAVIHESYNASTLANDILVFTLGKTVRYNVNIRPACLWRGNTELNRVVDHMGVVAGWGRSEFGPGGHGEPRMARIKIVSTETCRASKSDFHKLTSDYTLCAGDRNGVGPCLGDSGGGLYLYEEGRWRIRGIVSLSLRPTSGDNTCNLKEYVVFTDTAKYLDWIRNAMTN